MAAGQNSRCFSWSDVDVPQIMISTINTMNPMMPPPVPYCHAVFFWMVTSFASGAAKVRVARQSWRKAWKRPMLILVRVVLW